MVEVLKMFLAFLVTSYIMIPADIIFLSFVNLVNLLAVIIYIDSLFDYALLDFSGIPLVTSTVSFPEVDFSSSTYKLY